MAKKVVVAENKNNGKPKKKRVCLTCCLVLLGVCLVIFAGIFGAGWYFGDIYAQEYLDMRLGEVTGLFNGLYWANDKKVVKDGFTDDDRNGFYDEIKTNILLKKDVEIDFDAELKRAIEIVSNGMTEDSNNARAARTLNEGENGDGENNGESGDGENVSDGNGLSDMVYVFVELLNNVFKRENIDADRLAAYAEDNDEYVFNIKGNELASFVDFILDDILDSGLLDKLVPQVSDMISVKEAVAIKEISFKTQTVKSEIGESVVSASCADVTLWLGLQSAAGQALSALVDDAGFGWTSGLVKFAANVMLPKNLYITVSVPLEENAEVQVTLNGMSTEKREKLYKLINKIMALTGESDNYVEGFLDTVGDMVKEYIEPVQNSMDLSAVSNNVVKLDLIGLLADIEGQIISPDDPLTKSDFMYMLQALFTSSAENRLTELRPYLYDEWYRNASGKEEYDPADKTGFTKIDYEREFIDEIENKYCVDFGEAATLSEVLEMLGISLDGSSTDKSQEILDLVDAARFKASLTADINTLKLNVTDRMLAAGMSSQLNKVLAGDGGNFEGLDLKLDAITFVEKTTKPGHKYALLAVEADVSGMIGSLGGDILGSLALNIMPQKILLSMTVDITQSLPAGDSFDAAEFTFNDYGKTSNVLDTLRKFVPSFDLQSMTEQVETMLRSMVQQLDSTLGIELVPSQTVGDNVTSGKLVLPNIYKVITQMALVDETTGEPIVTDGELKDVLNGLNNTSGFDGESKVDDNNAAFIAQITDKYYLNPSARLESFADVTDFLSGDFSANKFRLSSDNPDPEVKYLVYDSRGVDDLTPEITDAQLGALIKANMTGETANFEILEVKIHPTSLDIVLKIDVSALLSDNKFASLIDADALYVTASVDMSADNGSSYPVTLRLNNMGSKQFNDMVKIVRFFDSGFDIDSQVGEIGTIMYEQMQNLKQSLGGDDYITFAEGKIKIASFYKFLAKKMELSSANELTVKKAVQGMYERTDAFPDNDSNYKATDFVVNAGVADGYDSTKLLTGMSDKQFNAFFAKMIQDSITQDGSVEAVQTIALSAADLRPNAAAVRTWANDKLKKSSTETVIESTKDYLIVTFRMNLNKGATAGSQSFIPTGVYVTVVLEKSTVGGKSAFESKGVIFNDMDAETYAVLLELMQLDASTSDEDKVNINSIVSQCVTDLNKLGTLGSVTFAPSADDGIGYITGSASL